VSYSESKKESFLFWPQLILTVESDFLGIIWCYRFLNESCQTKCKQFQTEAKCSTIREYGPPHLLKWEYVVLQQLSSLESPIYNLMSFCIYSN